MLQLWEKYKTLSTQVKASVWFLACSFLQRGISMLTTPIFTRLMSTSEYGQYNVFQSWMGILSVFITLNLSYGVYLQGLVKYEKERAVYSSSLQGLTLSLVLFWTCVYLAFSEFWNGVFSLSRLQMLAIVVSVWSTASIAFWSAEQRARYRYRILVAFTLSNSIVNPLLGIFLVTHTQDKVTARIIGMAFVGLLGGLSLFAVQMWRGRTFFHARFWKYAVQFNLPLLPHYLSMTVLSSADRIMIRDMVGESQAGIYALAYSVSGIMLIFNTSIHQALAPWQYEKIKRGTISDIAPVAYMTLILVACVNLALILFAPEIVAIFAPAPYYAAIWTIPPVAMSSFFIFSYDLYAKFAFYYEKTSLIMLASVCGALLNVLLNWIFIRRYGYIAAGYTTLCCYIVFSAAHYLLMTRICKRCLGVASPYRTGVILKIAAAFMAASFLLLFTYHNWVIRYGIAAAVLLAAWIRRGDLIRIWKRLKSLR